MSTSGASAVSASSASLISLSIRSRVPPNTSRPNDSRSDGVTSDGICSSHIGAWARSTSTTFASSRHSSLIASQDRQVRFTRPVLFQALTAADPHAPIGGDAARQTCRGAWSCRCRLLRSRRRPGAHLLASSRASRASATARRRDRRILEGRRGDASADGTWGGRLRSSCTNRRRPRRSRRSAPMKR